jgi:hypothetical protein
MPCWRESEEVLGEMSAIGMLCEFIAEVCDNRDI